MDKLWPSRNWIEIGGISYQLSDLYEYVAPNYHAYTESFIIAGYGCLILRFRRTKSGTLEIFLNDGSKVCSKACLHIQDIKSVFWLNNGNIGFLHFDCSITISSYALEILETIPAPEEAHVYCDYVFPNGIAFLTDTQNFYYFDNVQMYNVKIATITPPKSGGDLVQIAFSSLSTKTGFVASTKGDILAITSDSITPLHPLQFSPNYLVASPDGQSVAAIQVDKINVRSVSGEFKYNLPVNQKIDKNAVGFIDSKTLAIGLNDGLLIYNPAGKVSRHDIIPLWIGQDLAGVRIYTENYAYLLNLAPQKLLNLNKNPLANSIDKLVDSYEKFKSKDIDSYKILENLKPSLPQIISALCEAVPYITERAYASRVLEIAAYGKADAMDFDPETITKASKMCQMLFTLRSKEQGFAITASDLDELVPSDLVSFAAVGHKFPLASSLANYFHVNKSIIAQAWAQNMLEIHKLTGIPEILKRLSQYDKIDYLRLAKELSALGLDPSQAIQFIQLIRDPYSRAQALKKIYGPLSQKDVFNDVIASRDGDTILKYLFNLRNDAIQSYAPDNSNQEKPKNPENFKQANNLFQQVLRDSIVLADHYALFTMYTKWDRLLQIPTYPTSKVAVMITLAVPHNTFGKEFKPLSDAVKYETDPTWKDIITKQQNYTLLLAKTQDNNRGLPPPPREVISHLLKTGKSQDKGIAEKIAKNYQISDKMFFWIKIQTFAKYQMVPELESEILTRKAPIVNVNQIFVLCVSNQLKETALKFIQKHGNQFTQKSLFREAAAIAREQNNEILARQLEDKSKE